MTPLDILICIQKLGRSNIDLLPFSELQSLSCTFLAFFLSLCPHIIPVAGWSVLVLLLSLFSSPSSSPSNSVVSLKSILSVFCPLRSAFLFFNGECVVSRSLSPCAADRYRSVSVRKESERDGRDPPVLPSFRISYSLLPPSIFSSGIFFPSPLLRIGVARFFAFLFLFFTELCFGFCFGARDLRVNKKDSKKQSYIAQVYAKMPD